MQHFIKHREKKKYLWKSEWQAMEKPATASLNQPPGARLYSPVATGTVGTGLHRSLLLSYGRHQIRKDALTDVRASQGRRADGRPPRAAG